MICLAQSRWDTYCREGNNCTDLWLLESSFLTAAVDVFWCEGQGEGSMNNAFAKATYVL